MIISTRGRYALRVVLDIAENCNDKYIPMKDVAARQELSVKYLEQIMPILNKSGILESAHGKKGGYKLAKDVTEIRVGDILRLTEGDLAPVACLSAKAEACEKINDCRTRGLWEGLDKVINDYLDNITIDQLLCK